MMNDQKERNEALKMQRDAKKAQREAKRQQTLSEIKSHKIKNVGSTKGFKIAVVTLSIVASLLLAGNIAYMSVTTSLVRQVNNNAMRDFYQLVRDVNNLDMSISKTMASRGAFGTQKELLLLSSDAKDAERALSQIPVKEQSLQKLDKFFNQASQYSKVLAEKVARGKELSKEDRENLKTIYKSVTSVKKEINRGFEEISKKKNKQMAIKTLFQNNFDRLSSINLSQLNQDSIEYPTLIYDGPFSDNKQLEEKKEGKGVSIKEGKEMIEKSLKATKVVYENETKNTKIHTLNYRFEKEGVSVYVQIEKSTGKISLMNAYKPVGRKILSASEGVEFAKTFLDMIGYDNVKVVWKNESDNILTLNFAKEQEGIIIYPQLAKVKVSLNDGKILGLEGQTFVLNEKQRTLQAKISKDDARTKVSTDLSIKNESLALIPLGNSEKLCYEFEGTMDDMTFFVYIDAETGDQVNILKVIDTKNEGQMLM